jgi:hypothetical protein
VVVIPFVNWQVGCEPPPIEMAVGFPTVGVIVTVCEADFGPLQPVAVAVMVLVPDQPAAYVTCPVDELIVLPAPRLVASSE